MAKKTPITSGTKKWKTGTELDQNFNELLNSLNNSKVQQSNNALWQTIYELIKRAQTQKDRLVTKFKETSDLILDIGDTIINVVTNLKDATFWTKNDETLNFPSSIRVIAGPGITLDYSVANQVTVSSNGSGGVLPMIIGDEPPIFMSNGGGDLMIIPFDLPTEIP